MKRTPVFAIFVLLVFASCTPRSGSCDIVLTDNHVAVEGTHIVTEEVEDASKELEMNLRIAQLDSEFFTNEMDRLENMKVTIP